jgi:hypothetical protein
MNDPDVAKAYGISAITAALFCGGPAAVVLGMIAMGKGSRGLGCAAIILTVASFVIGGLLGASLIKELVGMVTPHAPALPGL